MPILVHLTAEQNVSRIQRSGIKATRGGPEAPEVVYCMPVLPNFSISHQWLRELKRWHAARTIVGITFRLASAHPVWVGHYNKEHILVPLGEAIRIIMQHSDARGYEVLVPRAIQAREITGVRSLPQVVGWRYQPDAHGRAPCPCPVCLPAGQYKSAMLRARLEPKQPPPTKPVLLARLAATSAPEELVDILWELARRGRRGGEELRYLLDTPSPEVRAALAGALGAYRGRTARMMLEQLAQDPDATVREEAVESLSERSR